MRTVCVILPARLPEPGILRGLFMFPDGRKCFGQSPVSIWGLLLSPARTSVPPDWGGVLATAGDSHAQESSRGLLGAFRLCRPSCCLACCGDF